MISLFLVVKKMLSEYPFIPLLLGALGFILMVAAAVSSISIRSKIQKLAIGFVVVIWTISKNDDISRND